MNILELRGNLHSPDPAVTDSKATARIYFVPELWVDQQPLANFSCYAVFLYELQQSTLRSGRFFILTCWCGMPECAGIYRPIEVWHTQEGVSWTISDPFQQEFIFALQEYRQVISDGIVQLRRDWTDLQAAMAGSSAEKLILVPGLPPDEALLAPKLRQPKPKRKPRRLC